LKLTAPERKLRGFLPAGPAPSAANTTIGRVSCKEMQGKPRKSPWISLDSFGRIGTFQWVMTNQIKKSPHPETRLPDCAPLKIPDALSLPPSPARGPRHIPPERRHYHKFLFNKRKRSRNAGRDRHLVFFTRALELSQRLGYCRRSALETRPKPSGLDARYEAPARANTSELKRAFRRDSVESVQFEADRPD
jgi:hypothetical protein